MPYSTELLEPNIGCYFRPYTTRDVRNLMNLRSMPYQYYKSYIDNSTVVCDFFGTTLFTILENRDGEEVHQVQKLYKHIDNMVANGDFDNDD